MAKTIRATRHITVEFRMLSEEIKDFYVQGLLHDRMKNYEPPVTEIILRLAGTFPETPWCFVDVGANTGIYTLAVAACHPSVCCHAYEPAPSIADVLHRNIDLNPHLKGRIWRHVVGLSSRAGTGNFHETINDHGFISTSSSLHAPGHLSYSEYPVELQKLDDQSFAHPVRLLKIDVEGHERDVLEGGRELVLKDRPVVIFEVLESKRGSHFDDFAESLNYKFISLHGNTFTCTPKFTPGDQFNYILCPSEQVTHVRAILYDSGLSAA